MELYQLEELMKNILSQNRYIHSLGVQEVSYDLALIYGADMIKASIAGILHDCARGLKEEELLTECKKYNLPVSEIEEKSVYLLHAKVGANFAKVMYGVKDEEILNAITYHTTGRPKMSLLEKIVFLSDYIEPNRKPLPRINEIRRVAYDVNIDYAVFMALENTLEYLKSIGVTIDTITVQTYNYYKTVVNIS